MKKMIFKKSALAVALAMGGLLGTSVAYALDYEFRTHEYDNVTREFIEKGAEKLLGYGLGELTGRLAKANTYGVYEEQTTQIILDYIVSFGLEIGKDELSEILQGSAIKTDGQKFHVNNRYFQETEEADKSIWEKIGDGILATGEAIQTGTGKVVRAGKFVADWTVIPVASTVPQWKGAVIAADLTVDLALLADTANKQMDKTQEFYTQAIGEIYDVYYAVLAERDFAILNATSPEGKRKAIESADEKIDILVNHLRLHKENIDSKYFAGFEISRYVKDYFISNIDAAITSMGESTEIRIRQREAERRKGGNITRLCKKT